MLWFRIQKFTLYAADAIQPLIAHSPFISWLGVFGVRGEAKVAGTIELVTATLLIIGAAAPFVSALGAAFASVTFILTVSFVFGTPGITQHSASGFPIISTLVEQFLIKDIVLLRRAYRLPSGRIPCGPAKPRMSEAILYWGPDP